MVVRELFFFLSVFLSVCLSVCLSLSLSPCEEPYHCYAVTVAGLEEGLWSAGVPLGSG